MASYHTEYKEFEYSQAAAEALFLFLIHKRTFQTHHGEFVLPITAVSPPSRNVLSSIVMIVTSSLPFQLDAQFHPSCPMGATTTPSEIGIPCSSPPSYMQLDLPLVSIQFCLFNLIKEHVREQWVYTCCQITRTGLKVL